MTYASELETLVGAGNVTEAEQTEGLAFFRTIAPMLPAADAEAITEALLGPAKGIVAKVGGCSGAGGCFAWNTVVELGCGGPELG